MANTINDDIGARLRRARKNRNLTLVDVEKLSGISISNLSRLETGKTRAPELRTIERIARAIKVPLKDLVA